MVGEKLRFCILAMSLMIVKGMTIDDYVLKESRPRTGEFVNTSINTPFMLQEVTTKSSAAGSLLFKTQHIMQVNKLFKFIEHGMCTT